jgi:hypothetical protein
MLSPPFSFSCTHRKGGKEGGKEGGKKGGKEGRKEKGARQCYQKKRIRD